MKLGYVGKVCLVKNPKGVAGRIGELKRMKNKIEQETQYIRKLSLDVIGDMKKEIKKLSNRQDKEEKEMIKEGIYAIHRAEEMLRELIGENELARHVKQLIREARKKNVLSGDEAKKLLEKMPGTLETIKMRTEREIGEIEEPITC